jgi:hypothetical protein
MPQELLYMFRKNYWKEQRITIQNFHSTKRAALRPDVLGSSLPEKNSKDYNGQTYWLSINLHSFLPTLKFQNG